MSEESATIALSQENFADFIDNAEKPVLVDFWAAWCGPCMSMGPILEDVAKTQDDFIVAKVNTDQNPDIAQAFRISAIPTMIVFKEGKAVGSITGAMPKEQLLSAVAKYI